MRAAMTQNTVFPVLYSVDKRGSKRMWKVSVVDDTVFTHYGIVGKKITESKRTVKDTTLNRSTTHNAVIMAERSWVKQLDKHYMPDASDEEGMSKYRETMSTKKAQGGTNHGIVNVHIDTPVDKKPPTLPKKEKLPNLVADNIEREILPMQASLFERADKCLKYFNFEYGVYIQPKYDGWRCIARLQSDGTVVLTSRTGKQYPWFGHIRDAVRKYLFHHPREVLDGELYTHELTDEDGNELTPNEKFELIQSMCGMKRSVPHPREQELKYYVFDIVDSTIQQGARLEKLNPPANGPIVVSQTHRCFSVDEINYWWNKFESEGYEGAVIRAHDLVYEEKHRSLKMRKLKSFDDAEYKICGFSEAQGDQSGCVVWKCRTGSGQVFDVVPKGTFEKKRALYRDGAKHVGKLLKVKYQGLSSDGIPRFPVGLSFREEFM